MSGAQDGKEVTDDARGAAAASRALWYPYRAVRALTKRSHASSTASARASGARAAPE